MDELLPNIRVVEHAVREASTNTDFDMREMLGLDQALQRMQGELTNNVSKLTSIQEHITREQNKLEDMQSKKSSLELES